MKAARIIIGVVTLAGGIASFIWPAFGISMIVWLFVFIMLALGLTNVIQYFATDKVHRQKMALGVGNLILGIVLAGLAIFIMVNPAAKIGIGTFAIVFFAINLFFNGIDLIMVSFGVMNQSAASGIFMILFGILELAAGVFCMTNILAGMFTLGLVIGVSLIAMGAALIITPALKKD